VVWQAWFASVAAVLVCFRGLLPTARALRHRTVVAAVLPETPDVVSIRITGRRMDRFGGRAGQFVRVRFLTTGRWWQSHPFSMSTAPDAGAVRISVKAAGDHTAGLARLAPGTRVVLSGPYGGLLASRSTRDRVVLIAAGIGITPLRALFEALPAGGDRLVLLYRAGREVDLALRGELDGLVATRGGRVHYLTGPRPADPADHPLGPEALRTLVPDIAERDVFLCGPPTMMSELTCTLRSLGVPAGAIHQERFAF
jgi:ferredoxin-NADP reductase